MLIAPWLYLDAFENRVHSVCALIAMRSRPDAPAPARRSVPPQELEQQTELIEAAAAQIALEQRLGPQAQEALRLKMLERVVESAHELRATMLQRQADADAASAHAGQKAGGAARPASAAGRLAPGMAPGMGTLSGILSRASPRGEVQQQVQPLPNPIKGRGACNPLPTGAPSDSAPFDTSWGAAGQAAAVGSRSGSGGSGGGGSSGTSGAQHAGHLRLEHHSPSKHGYRPESQVSFGGPARILYPCSDVMIRGKYPGY